MLVLHDDISTGKRCVAGEIVADEAYASTSNGFMVLCRPSTYQILTTCRQRERTVFY